jgi:prophage regulatory protein
MRAPRLLRLNEVVALTGLSRMTIWRMERTGAFPSRRQLGGNSVAWLESDVHEWIESRPPVRLRSAIGVRPAPTLAVADLPRPVYRPSRR